MPLNTTPISAFQVRLPIASGLRPHIITINSQIKTSGWPTGPQIIPSTCPYGQLHLEFKDLTFSQAKSEAVWCWHLKHDWKCCTTDHKRKQKSWIKMRNWMKSQRLPVSSHTGMVCVSTVVRMMFWTLLYSKAQSNHCLLGCFAWIANVYPWISSATEAKAINFGRTPVDNCKAVAKPAFQPHHIFGTENKTSFTMEIGLSPSDQGYSALTGENFNVHVLIRCMYAVSD